MNAGGYIAGGLTSSIKGQHFPPNYVSLWQSLCFWSVITVIYSCGFPLKGFPLCLFPEWNLWLFAAMIWCFPSPALCLQIADTDFSTLHVVGIFLFWNCYFLIKLISEDLRLFLCYERLGDGISSITANHKSFIMILNVRLGPLPTSPSGKSKYLTLMWDQDNLFELNIF